MKVIFSPNARLGVLERSVKHCKGERSLRIICKNLVRHSMSRESLLDSISDYADRFEVNDDYYHDIIMPLFESLSGHSAIKKYNI